MGDQNGLLQNDKARRRACIRRCHLRRVLRDSGVDAQLPDGWAVAPSRLAHRMVDGKSACGATWIDDGDPPAAPLHLCLRCQRGQRPITEDWSKFR